MNRQISKKQVALIHVAKAQLGLSDEVYREMLGSVGVLSSLQLTGPQFNELMNRMEAGGFRVTGGQPEGGKARSESWKRVHKSAVKSGMHRQPPQETEAMIRKIAAILADLGLGWGYADGMARRMFGIDRLTWCDAGQTHKVLQALCVHQQRAKRRAG